MVNILEAAGRVRVGELCYAFQPMAKARCLEGPENSFQRIRFKVWGLELSGFGA